MAEHQREHERRRYRRLFPLFSAVLFDEWDPIGVRPHWPADHPRDEYDSYVPGLIRLVLEQPDINRIAAKLSNVAGADNLESSLADRRRVAQRLIEIVETDSRTSAGGATRRRAW